MFLRFLACAYQEAGSLCFASPLALLPTCLPRGRRSPHRKSACPSFRRYFHCLRLLHHILVVQFLALASLVLLSLTTLHHWERTPLWHGYCSVAQVPAQLSSLLPPGVTLINKTIVLMLSATIIIYFFSDMRASTVFQV